jgi:hypothetical protein
MSASFLVPSGSAAAQICDTGALLDYLVASVPRTAVRLAAVLRQFSHTVLKSLISLILGWGWHTVYICK